MELACRRIFRLRWSDDIQNEWVRNVIKDRPDLAPDMIRRRRASMDIALPQARVDGYRGIIAGLSLPDPNDRHVLAAAIVGRADVIVTYNWSDFPTDLIAPYGIDVQHPDAFLNDQWTVNEPLFVDSIRSIRARLKNPAYDADAYIANVRKNQLHLVADALVKVRELL